jgi:hypothetical protein
VEQLADGGVLHVQYAVRAPSAVWHNVQGSCSSADHSPLCCAPLLPQAFPDVVSLIQQAAAGGSSSLVLDAELVAVDRAAGCRLLAFQELAGRARGEVQEHQVITGGRGWPASVLTM